MPFWPDTIWGLSYLTALAFFGFLTIRGGNAEGCRILIVLAVHWLLMRTIATYDHVNFLLWIGHDGIIALSFTWFGNGRFARACAAMFAVQLLSDTYSLAMDAPFEAASAVAETTGYLAMILMAGASDDFNGNRRSDYARRPLGRGANGLVGGLHDFPRVVESRGPDGRQLGVLN